MTITFEDFDKVELVVGTITKAEVNEKARKPAYKLWVDCGEDLGMKQSSAQITDLYKAEDLIGKRVLCVANFEPIRIAGFKSEVLVTGVHNNKGEVVLATLDPALSNQIINGTKLF